MPTDNKSQDKQALYQDHIKTVRQLWSLLAQTARGSAASIVEGFVEGNTDGCAAWMELERLYGGRAQDKRPMQLLPLEGRLRYLSSSSEEEASGLVIKLYTISMELETLGDREPGTTKREALLIGIRGAQTQAFFPLATQADATYGHVERAVVSSWSCLTSGAEICEVPVSFRARTNRRKTHRKVRTEPVCLLYQARSPPQGISGVSQG